jgi:hypothetical protein
MKSIKWEKIPFHKLWKVASQQKGGSITHEKHQMKKNTIP